MDPEIAKKNQEAMELHDKFIKENNISLRITPPMIIPDQNGQLAFASQQILVGYQEPEEEKPIIEGLPIKD